MQIRIIDAPMGQGKTSWSIQHINEDASNNYVYITPFLSEVKRVKDSCPDRKFREPTNFGKGKQDNFHELLFKQTNIVSTHALFHMSTDVTRNLVASGSYILILDEVMDVIEQLPLKKDDLPFLLQSNLVYIEDGILLWNEEFDDYDGKYNDIKTMAKNKTLMVSNHSILMWNFPVEVFRSFKEVYILTYMFKKQIQRFYYDLHNVKYEFKTVEKYDGGYQLVEYYDIKLDVKHLINICDNEKLNAVGETIHALSSSWFSRNANKILLDITKNNLLNYFTNIMKSPSKDNLWTTFKSVKPKLSGKGYTNGFVSCNLRATNDYKDKHCLAYCLNIYLNPIVKQFFYERGIEIDEDGYALSEMTQWIWRSAIRNSEEISIYIPSSRMRNLLIEFIGNSHF